MAEISIQGVSKTFPDGSVALQQFDLRIEDGEFLILVGPSGCGKSTALRMIAGLDEPTTGDILIDGESVEGVAPADRDVAMVFQNYALYPHMSVARNLAFPLRMAGTDRAEIRRRVAETARSLELDELLQRLPGELSGGQRQRVAMGRAMIRQPKAYLMDEPLSNLDAKLRVQMRAHLARLHETLQTTTVYVTHDQVEAMTLGARVAVMDHGLIRQVAAPSELYDHPVDTYVASFLGSPPMNFLGGQVSSGSLGLEGHASPVQIPTSIGMPDGPVVIGIRPEDLSLGPPPSGENALAVTARADVVERLGTDTIVYASSDEADIIDFGEHDESFEPVIAVRLHGRASVKLHERMRLHVKVSDLHFFDADSGKSFNHAD